jgi:capsid protein
VIESEGYDAEEVDRRIAADHAREQELGLSFGQKAQGQDPAASSEPDPEDRDPYQTPTTEENAA